MIKVSVILPVYGVADYIEACVKSLLAQTLEDVEFLTAFLRLCFRCSSISVCSFTLCIRFCTRSYFADCNLIPSACISIQLRPPVPSTFPLWERLFADPFAPPAFTGFITTTSQSDF